MPSSTVVLISPHFPPSTLAGVHRARHLAKHLPAAGWKPIVVCVDERDHEEPLDPALADLLPREIEVIKVRAAPASLTRLAGIGDVSLRAFLGLRRTLLHLFRTRRIDAVMITGSPFYSMLLAPEIKRRHGVPVLVDFQDPWVSAWGADQPLLSKAGLAHRLAVALEPSPLRATDFVTTVSEVQNAELVKRYAWLDANRMAAIPIGGDPDDFTMLRDRGPADAALVDDPEGIHFSYVGTCLPRAEGLFRALFRGFVHLRSDEPALAKRIRFHFVGTSNQPGGDGTYRVRPIAEAEGAGDSVHEMPQRLPYFQALNWLLHSQGLLLIGSDESHYTASKIYPALMSGKPFISLFHRASSAHAILSSAGGGRAFAFETSEELMALAKPLAEALRALALQPQSVGKADPAAYAPYTAAAVSRRFAEIFDRLGAEHRLG